jgi:hypothetical protein
MASPQRPFRANTTNSVDTIADALRLNQKTPLSKPTCAAHQQIAAQKATTTKRSLRENRMRRLPIPV